MRLLLTVLVWFALTSQPLHAATPILVQATADGRVPILALDILEDAQGKLRLDDVMSPRQASRFVAMDGTVPNYGFTRSAYWVRFTLESQLNEPAHYLLELAFPRLEDIRFYRPGVDGGYEVKRGGTLMPFTTRELPYRNHVFHVQLAPKQSQTFYLRVASSTSAVQLPLALWTPSALEAHKTNEYLVLGLYAGVLLAMLFYNLFIYFSLREATYFYYVLCLLLLLPAVIDFEGLSGQYLWPQTPALSPYFFSFVYPLFFASLTRFAQLFLNTATTHPKMNRILSLIIGVNIAVSLLGTPFPDTPVTLLRNSLASIVATTLLYVGFACLRSGYRPARFYTLASVAFLGGIILLALERAGLLPRSTISVHAWQLGSMLEMLLLSLALADKINFLKQQNLHSQQQVLELQKEANVALETKVSQRTRAIEQSPVSIVITDANGLIEYVNPKFTELSGYTFDEVIGKNPNILHSGKTPPETFRDLWAKITSGREWRGLFLNKKKNGELYWESASISPIVDASGLITHFVGVKEDITERKQLEEALRNAKTNAEKASEAKSELLASMSHELRTPLNSILGFAQLLKRETNITPKIQDGLRIIENSGNHLLTLINDILDLSKIEAGKMESHPVSIELSAVLGKVTDIMSQRILSKGLQWNQDYGHDLPRHVVADPKQLTQVLINLLGNAVKFTEQGAITLTVKREGTKIRFAVQDTGIGIPKDKQDSVFSRFIQLHDTSRFEGTGLGLYISQRMVELMGGHIELSSEEGKGTCFWFDLPLKVSDSANQQALTDIAITGYIGERKRILVVDDIAANRHVLCGLLQEFGFETAQAENGAVGLELAQTWDPDLVFMDFHMPGMNGLETTRSIRAVPLHRQPNIILSTANSDPSLLETLKQAGGDGFLMKPIDQSALLELLQTQLKLEWETEPLQANIDTVPIVVPPVSVLAECRSLLQRGNMAGLLQYLSVLLADTPEYSPALLKMRTLADGFELEELELLLLNYVKQSASS